MKKRRIKVGSVDLAMKPIDTGFAVFEAGGQIVSITTGQAAFVPAPPGEREWSADEAAAELMRFATEQGLGALVLDGVQGWADPSPGGPAYRVSEFLLAPQCKAGVPGVTLPGTYKSWVEFAIAVFGKIVVGAGAEIANDWDQNSLGQGLRLYECLPSATWKHLQLQPLPAKRRTPPALIQVKANQLATCINCNFNVS